MGELQSIKCIRSNGDYLCVINNKVMRFKEIIIDGEVAKDERIVVKGYSKIKGKELEIQKSEATDEISFLKEYYRKNIPTQEEMKKAKLILRKYKTPEEKQELYFKIIGHRPRNAICIYDKVTDKEMERSGFIPKKHKKETYEYVKKTNGKSIVAIVNKEHDDIYRISLISVYKGRNIYHPVCITDKGIGITLGGRRIG